MTATEVAVAILLTAGVGVVLLCCLGLLLARDVFDRLHCLGPATSVGAVAVAAAVVVEAGASQAAVKAVLVALALLGTSSVLTHATARAARLRRYQSLKVRDDEEGAR